MLRLGGRYAGRAAGTAKRRDQVWAMVGRWGRRLELGAVLVWAGFAVSSCRAEESQALVSAHWIAAGPDAQAAGVRPRTEPMPIFRRSFRVGAGLQSATLEISGLGQFEAHIDGRNVTRALLTPGWSDYRKRIYYDRYDVTRLLHAGGNAVGVLLGNGMYHVEETPGRYTKFTGSFGRPKLIAALTLRYRSGATETIVTDRSWKTAEGPITFSSTYGGEDYDARRNQPGWDGPGFYDHAWSAATPVAGPGGELVQETIPPVVANETYRPVRVTTLRPGVTVYDLGENMAGWPELSVRGAAGSSVRMLAGELLDASGAVTQRSANAGPKDPNYFLYTLRGAGLETWHPRFSYYGFRYVQVEATPAASGGSLPEVVDLDGRFLHDAVSVDGAFHSSNDLLNRIHRLITRAMLSNMVSVLTDCPHREKLGWLEQTHLAGASLMYNYGLAGLYGKMAADMRDAQLDDGLVPDIAPEYPVFGGGFRDSPEWGAASILSPWAAYTFYGDLDLLRAQYPAMQRYAAYLKSKAKGHIVAYGLGDWYDIGPKPPGVSQLTSLGVTGTAVYFQALNALARTAELLGRPQDAADDRTEAEEVRSAFNARYFAPETDQYDRESQTALAMPLAVGLVPEEHRAGVLANLVAAIRATGNHVTAGDVGFHYVVRALTDGGRSDVLYDMLERTDKPSYGDQLAHGATTLTEAWDANPNSSQNHFMLGHAEEWFYRGLAGIDLDMSRDPKERIRIAPNLAGDLTNVSAQYRSRLGVIASAWTRSEDAVRMDVRIPAGETATILFPPEFRGSIRLDGRPLTQGGAVLRVALNDTKRRCVVAGGTYHFELRR